MPARGKRTRLGLAVADNGAYNQVGVVECGTERVHEGVAEFAAFVDRAWSLRCCVAGDPAREGELAEEPPHPFGVLGDVRIRLGVAALEITIGDHARATVTRAR